MNVTVFKIDEKLFGVESEKVIKLFKVPSTFHDKYSDQQRVRLKEFEVKLIDLRKIFSVKNGDRKEELIKKSMDGMNFLCHIFLDIEGRRSPQHGRYNL